MDNIKYLFNLAQNNQWDEFNDYLKNIEDIDVNIRDNSNNYLINYAIIQNSLNTVSLLINKGSRLDINDPDGKSIMYIPIKYNFLKMIEVLIRSNYENIGISLFDIKDKNGNTPLHYAIMFKNLDVIKLLLPNSDVNIKDNQGNNSLHLAIYSREYDIVDLIVNDNIDINARTDIGETALHIAVNFQLNKIVDLLLSKNISINIQDYDHEFTALHYAVNLNAVNIVDKLISNKNININIQDFIGNTPLHYSIIEENYEIMGMILNSKNTHYTLNINLFNIDNKLPLHIFLEKYENKEYLDKYLAELINGSNLNFQDKTGSTILHLICKLKIWTKFRDNLEKKKLNIFINNRFNKMPIDYIEKEDFNDFIDLIAKSYLYILRNYNFIWRESWENYCTKELFTNKINLTKDEYNELNKFVNISKLESNKDICLEIVKKKLIKLHKISADKCLDRSYPIKQNQTCINIEEGTRLEYCSFVGITLDILIGLIYLLQKHNNACSTITTNFLENKDLCNYYKSIGIITNTKCEFLNFEIVWIYHKLYFSENFRDNLKKCYQQYINNKRFVIIPLGIELRHASHANYIIIDRLLNEIERFEPYGSGAPYKFNYNPEQLDSILEFKFKEIDENLKYIRPKDYMPKIGFQYYDTIETKRKMIADPEGFCALWSIWYTDMRLTYSDINRNKLVNKIMKEIKQKNISYKNMIRNYSKNITDIRDNIFESVKITINDWLNDQYTSEQIISIVNAITLLIANL